MIIPRIIPVLLLQKKGLVKTLRFKHPVYIGDPLNAVHIFNEKEVDELIFLDIDASSESRNPDISFIKEIASECFMPFTYGGGIKTIEQVRDILKAGAEKVSINSEAVENPDFITNLANIFGSQSIVVSIDFKKSGFGKDYFVYKNNGKIKTKYKAVDFAGIMENAGAGELLLTSVDSDGTMKGYDLQILEDICTSVRIPSIICGGAGSLDDLKTAYDRLKYSGAAAGSLFVFYHNRNSVLINYPTRMQIKQLFIKEKNEQSHRM